MNRSTTSLGHKGEVLKTLELRHRDLQNVIAAKMRGADEDDINKVYVWMVEKAIRLSDKFNPARASCWTWLCMIAYGQVARFYRTDGAKRVTPESLSDIIGSRTEPGESYEDALILAIDLKREGVTYDTLADL